MHLRISKGVIWQIDGQKAGVLDIAKSIQIALANGHSYSHTFISKYNGWDLVLDDQLRIIPADSHYTKPMRGAVETMELPSLAPGEIEYQAALDVDPNVLAGALAADNAKLKMELIDALKQVKNLMQVNLKLSTTIYQEIVAHEEKQKSWWSDFGFHKREANRFRAALEDANRG